MTAAEFLGHLAARGGYFTVEGEKLRYHGPRGLATPAMVDFVRSHRQELRALLQKPEGELTDAELAALGYRRRAPGASILAEDREDAGWVPPDGWGLEEQER